MSNLLSIVNQINLPTKLGNFNMLVFENIKTSKLAIALTLGKVKDQKNVLVRIHSACLTGDVFGSILCDCGPQLNRALTEIKKKGKGVLIYLDQEGRGIGLKNKIMAMALQQAGLDSVDANLALGLPVDMRTFEEAVEIIRKLGVKSTLLLTNNPDKINQLRKFGVDVAGRMECVTPTFPETERYLKTKKERMGHLLPE